MKAAKLLIVADDLTGACDSAVGFALRGLRTHVDLGGGALAGSADVMAVSTDSRDIAGEEAQRRLLDLITSIPEGAMLFKKLDSVFRGNTYVEILSMIELARHELLIIAPAYPAAGRLSVDGVVVSTDISGERHIPVLQELRSRGLRLGRLERSTDADALRAQLMHCVQDGDRVVYCDAEAQVELEALAEAGLSAGLSVLWMGSAGLAHALAHRLTQGVDHAVRRRERRGAVIVFAGSDHAVTAAQLEHLRAERGVKEYTAAGDGDEAASDEDVILVRVPRGIATEAEVWQLVRPLKAERVGCMVMTGGDTASMVCGALGVTALELSHEFAPGLPQGFAVGGAYDGVPVILKSGGFGDSDVLSRIAMEFSRVKEAVA